MKRAEINQRWKFGTGKSGRLDKGDSLGERTTSPIRPKSRSCICEALEAFRTPVPHSTCSEPRVGWAPPSRRRALSRRGSSLTSWVRSGELDIAVPRCFQEEPVVHVGPSLLPWGNVPILPVSILGRMLNGKWKTSTFTTSLLALQTFSILLVSKNQVWYLLFLELLKFFHLFSCFYLHDHLSTTFCGLFLTI